MHSLEGPSIVAALERRVRSGASPPQIAEAVAAAWRHIDASLAPIIGPLGVAALYKRSLLLTGRLHPWLPQLDRDASSTVDVAALVEALAQRDSNSAASAGGELLQTFYGLLTNLIGVPLTDRLLGSIWQTF